MANPVIYVDADACPVKQEIYKVARRYQLKVILVSNSWMRTPGEDWLELVVVGNGFDEADDWIVERAGNTDIVVTGDIELAGRCLKNGARTLAPRGRIFDEDSIGHALGMRELMSHMRDSLGETTGGPPPFEQRDRSTFLQSLDELVHAVKRGKK